MAHGRRPHRPRSRHYREPPSRLETLTRLLGVMTAMIVVLSPMVYVNGRAYHDGWYQALNLDPLLFPVDTATVFMWARLAWVEGMSYLILKAFAHMHVIVYWLAGIAFVVTIGVLFRKYAVHVDHKNPRAKSPPPETRFEVLQVVVDFFDSAFFVVLSIMLCVWAFIVATLMLGAWGTSFERVGAHDARVFVQTELKERPLVTVKLASGNIVNLPEVGCGPLVCAFWDAHRAILLPVSAVVSGVSDPPKWETKPVPDGAVAAHP